MVIITINLLYFGFWSEMYFSKTERYPKELPKKF